MKLHYLCKTKAILEVQKESEIEHTVNKQNSMGFGSTDFFLGMFQLVFLKIVKSSVLSFFEDLGGKVGFSFAEVPTGKTWVGKFDAIKYTSGLLISQRSHEEIVVQKEKNKK